jgi:uncharacterized protein (DUF2237 family)
MTERLNVLGGPLDPCSFEPMTGYKRNGCCDDGPDDPAPHTVCAIMTKEFIAFQDSIGNNLSVPEPDKRFPGLVPGNRWCVLTAKWYEAYQNGVACPVVLSATNKAALDIVPLDALLEHAVDKPAGRS